jgi:transcriptional regulator with XRE-family HTH domain
MSPEDLRHLRHRFRLTQVQFADRLGVSPALVASLECGRRRITERHVREIHRIFGDDVYRRQPVPVQNTVAATASARRRKRSLTLVDLFRGFTGTPPARVPSASAPKLVSKSVHADQPATVPASTPLSVLRPLVVTWSRCTWRDPEFGLCGGLTPQGMLYCAVHMTLALIEGSPTRRR